MTTHKLVFEKVLATLPGEPRARHATPGGHNVGCRPDVKFEDIPRLLMLAGGEEHMENPFGWLSTTNFKIVNPDHTKKIHEYTIKELSCERISLREKVLCECASILYTLHITSFHTNIHNITVIKLLKLFKLCDQDIELILTIMSLISSPVELDHKKRWMLAPYRARQLASVCE